MSDLKENIEIMGNIRKTGYEDIEKRIKKIEIKERINYKK